MGTHLNQETSSIEAKLRSKLLHDDHHVQKGGLRTMPFIISTLFVHHFGFWFWFNVVFYFVANEAFEGITGQGLTSNMIFYLMEVYHMEVATGAIILSIWNSLSSGLSIVGGFISDSYLGRFRVIATGSLFSLVVSPYHPYSYMGRVWAQTEYKTKNSSFHFC
ncbi:putative proton-dependent oligopeptide transporter family, MFS transporter superfamily [Helianthus annuus]|uniref:Proton-dependent oligopeptide transporter family, MFS transporter superfamily n=1 Tax=Helianthus annuus TaxID=4232 RepID=A0A251RKT0_HELAN|nr:putative proton-dependent oligopeptide transporter family, MFS transporter superfamily [Helianthus annuus]KAJ0624886.1 putative proton-dependent oligopeptide transporter family, MFS transporter superfamily [Helianthus annuus]KAJ0628552.1 putative proton-dependent oligopeptide transporter family, MFS transporter superfamily [Helianthus annuus]KAJ0784885.1 putative proton-dependent oligopeptide transporter family, MFS transporter superfamily [Helianthus annuus]KAJ0949955.1 putative proton-depe